MSGDPFRLIEAYFDGEISAEEEKDLAAWLEADPENRRLFIREAHAHRQLREAFRAQGEGRASGTLPSRRRRPRRRWEPSSPRVWLTAAAAAAALAVLAGGILLSRRSAPPAAPVVAESPAVGVPAPREVSPETVPGPVPAPPAPPPPAPAPVPPVPPPAPPPAEEPASPEPPAPPAPDPIPVPPPAENRETVAAAVRLDRAVGKVFMTEGRKEIPARGGEAILDGQGLQTSGPESLAIFSWADGTSVELGGETSVSRISGEGGDRRISLSRGRLSAHVVRAPAGSAVVFLTPHAEARVLGTRLTLSVEAGATRLEVQEGVVRFGRLPGGKAVEVRAGTFAVASADRDPKPQPLVPGTDRKDSRAARLLQDHEGTVRWRGSDYGAKLSTGLVTEPVARGRRALRIGYEPKPGDPQPYGFLEHPLRLKAGDTALRFSIRVEGAAGRARLFLHFRDRDGDIWVLKEFRLGDLPSGWEVVTAEIPPASRPPARTESAGDGRYDPLAAQDLILGVGYGQASVWVDEFEILSGPAPPAGAER